MEFWGVEVKAGQPLKVKPEFSRLIHISQAALGEGKKEKGNELIPLRLNINGDKFIVGSLSADKFPQITFDLVFEKEFELSHDWKNGSIYFCGYVADNPFTEDEDDFDSEESDEDEGIPPAIAVNGKVEPKAEEGKPAVAKGKNAKPESSAKPKAAVVQPKKDESDDDDDSDEDEDESDDDKDMMDASDDIGDSEDEDDSEDGDDSEDEDEETPKKKADPGKKRPTGSATKTPVPAKKSKIDTPQKTDGKKGGGHIATPHPAKQAGKTPGSNKSKEQTPKSEGKVACKSCSKTFNSEGALQSHSKAKHGGK